MRRSLRKWYKENSNFRFQLNHETQFINKFDEENLNNELEFRYETQFT